MKFDALLTRILKGIAVVGLVLLATLLVRCEITWVRDSSISWHRHAGTMLLFFFCISAAYLLVRRQSHPIADVYCSRCHALGGHTEITSYRRSVSPFAFHFGGFLFSIIYSASKEQRFRCRECGETFSARTAISRAYRVLFILGLAFIVNLLWSEIAEFWE